MKNSKLCYKIPFFNKKINGLKKYKKVTYNIQNQQMAGARRPTTLLGGVHIYANRMSTFVTNCFLFARKCFIGEKSL